MALIDTLMTPRIDAKIRSRLFASKLKNKLPDFKDILRERFKIKIRQNRRALFQQMRSVSESNGNVQSTLFDYLHEEINGFGESNKLHNDTPMNICDNEENHFDIERELEIMKQIETELLEEQLNWIMNEYRKEEEEIFKGMTNEPFLCPVCQRGYLQKDYENVILCNGCPIKLFTPVTLEKLNILLRETLNEHSSHCDANPQFTVINEPNSSGLFIICQKCSLFNLLC